MCILTTLSNGKEVKEVTSQRAPEHQQTRRWQKPRTPSWLSFSQPDCVEPQRLWIVMLSQDENWQSVFSQFNFQGTFSLPKTNVQLDFHKLQERKNHKGTFLDTKKYQGHPLVIFLECLPCRKINIQSSLSCI